MHNTHCEALSGPTNLQEHNATTNGVVRNSSLNKSNFFHVDGMAPDIMHDILEGVLQVSLIVTLKDLILKKSFFTIQTLNQRLQSFNYGPIDSNNKPTKFKEKGSSDINDIKQSGKFDV